MKLVLILPHLDDEVLDEIDIAHPPELAENDEIEFLYQLNEKKNDMLLDDDEVYVLIVELWIMRDENDDYDDDDADEVWILVGVIITQLAMLLPAEVDDDDDTV